MDRKARHEAIHAMAQDFYRFMPDAPAVPLEQERGWLWGEVEHTDHYKFCELIATRIIDWSGRAIVRPD